MAEHGEWMGSGFCQQVCHLSTQWHTTSQNMFVNLLFIHHRHFNAFLSVQHSSCTFCVRVHVRVLCMCFTQEKKGKKLENPKGTRISVIVVVFNYVISMFLLLLFC